MLTNDQLIADAGAYGDFLLARSEVTGSAISTIGYCLGGRMSLVAAGALGRTIAAAASFHGGRLAIDGDPSSPHLSPGRTTATLYVAGAKEDNSFRRAGRAPNRSLLLPIMELQCRQPDAEADARADVMISVASTATRPGSGLCSQPELRGQGTGQRSTTSTRLTSQPPESATSRAAPNCLSWLRARHG